MKRLVEVLQNQNNAMKEALRQMEWIYVDDAEDACFFCASTENSQHSNDCIFNQEWMKDEYRCGKG